MLFNNILQIPVGLQYPISVCLSAGQVESWIDVRIFKVHPLFKGVHYYLGFLYLLSLFKGAHYSRGYIIQGNSVLAQNFRCFPHILEPTAIPEKIQSL